MSGTKAAIDNVLQCLANCREDDHFARLYTEAETQVEELDLQEIQVPRQRRPPRRYSGPADAFQAQSPMEYFRAEYYKLIDTATSKLSDVVQQEGAKVYSALEACLISGRVDESCLPYPELDIELLRVQLQMFRQQFDYTSIDEAADVLRNSVPEVQQLFQQVDLLVRLLLVIPVTSCEAERSFSSLRRLKTWLRSTMTQHRLNHVAICSVHHDYIDRLNMKDLANAFASRTDRRQLSFGKF